MSGKNRVAGSNMGLSAVIRPEVGIFPDAKWQAKKSPSIEGLSLRVRVRPTASGHLNDGLHDGALSGDGLGVRLIVALGLDQVYQLVGQVDVGVLQGFGHDRTQGAGLRGVETRLTRRIGFFPSGAARRLQALFVVEA